MSTAVARASNERYREATYDPFEDDMGENSLQRFISELFRPQVEDYLAERQGPTFVGADHYVGWDPDDGEKVLAPDVYVLPGVEPGVDFEFWKVWQTGIVPSFALEIVSKRKKKDYTEIPPLYGELGVEELFIFDPRFKDMQHLDAGQLERLDYLVAQLKKNGIYVNINLHVARSFTAADGFVDAGKLPPLGAVVNYFEPRMIERRIASNLI